MVHQLNLVNLLLIEEGSDVSQKEINRVLTPLGKAYRKANFGLIRIDWNQSDPTVTMQIRGVDGVPQVEKVVRISDLSFPPLPSDESN